METVIIKLDKEYQLFKTNKAFILYETLTGKKISQLEDSYTDTMTLFYCFLRGANRNTFTIGFDEFVDLTDAYEGQIEVFNKYMEDLTKPVEGKPAKKNKK